MESKSYFLPSSHGINNLQQTKGNSKSDARIPKPPKPPEKPLMPYMRYSRKVWEQVKNSNPHLKLWEVGKIIGQMWRELPDDEKTLYVEEYDTEKTQYAEALRQYHSSPTYQAWLVAKERAERTMEEQDQERRQVGMRSRDRMGEIPSSDLRESYILEDNEEDSEDQYTAKHVAAARFQRNHRLMQEILSDTRLPDPGQLITQSRLNTLRLQVEQLKTHKRNLCQEIEGCEVRHRAKIQRTHEESEKFVEDYQKLTAERPMITEQQFADMIIKAKHDLQREEEERVSRYLAEVEVRRRRQQQRQQREAEMAAEVERRRQQQVQQAQMRSQQMPEGGMQQSNDRYMDRPPVQQDSKNDQSPLPSPKSAAVLGSTGVKPNASLPETSIPNINTSYGSNMTTTFPPTSSSSVSMKFNPSGHTQHHYPPPPNYSPNATSPPTQTTLPQQRNASVSLSQTTAPSTMMKTSPLPQPKKPSSSGSSTSSVSSCSSNSSKKKKAEEGTFSKEKKPQSESVVSAIPSDRRIVSESVPEHVKGNDVPPAGGPLNEYLQGVGPQLPMVRQVPQHYVQQQPQLPPSGSVQGVSHGQFPYEQPAATGPPMSGSNYYHHPPSMPQSVVNPGNYPPHARPPFTQHPNYGPLQYPPHQPQPPTSEHAPPPPPPMYVQHMPPQQHLSQPGAPMMGSPPQSSSGHPHQSPVVGWHQPNAPGYPTQYAPRYPNVPPGYPVRQMPLGGGSYMMAPHPAGAIHHQGSQPPHQQGGVSAPTSMIETSVANQQQIPAPPPYQQQQQQQPQTNVPSGYWAGSQQIPPDYIGPSSQQYIPTPHPDSGTLVPSSGSMEGIQSGASMQGRIHPDSGTGHMGAHQSQQSNMYYSNYPPMPSSYGQPGNMNANGFYGVQQQQHQGGGGHYPPPNQGSWASYPPHMGQLHSHGYQSGQPPNAPPQITGQIQNKGDSSAPSVTMESAVPNTSGCSSRPSSVGN